MNVLSLFDGISACRLALERSGFTVDTYYTSEIDKYAEKISDKNYPDAIRLGDVTNWESWDIDWKSIDLVTGGFPCQAWSVAGKQLGDKDERGMLFWTMLDIMKNVLSHNPKAKFLIENVKMKKEFEQYITFHTEQALGHVEKHLINSALVSAQNRQRYYWTNIHSITQPEDKGLVLKDVIESINLTNPCEPRNYKETSICHHAADATDINGNQPIKHVYAETGKAPTLTTMGGGNTQPKVLTGAKPRELKQMKSLTDKSKPLLASMWKGSQSNGMTNITDGLTYRKLTPLECERLQTFPDGWTEGVSITQRYKALGNAWTVDVVAHIFSFMKPEQC